MSSKYRIFQWLNKIHRFIGNQCVRCNVTFVIHYLSHWKLFLLRSFLQTENKIKTILFYFERPWSTWINCELLEKQFLSINNKIPKDSGNRFQLKLIFISLNPYSLSWQPIYGEYGAFSSPRQTRLNIQTGCSKRINSGPARWI